MRLFCQTALALVLCAKLAGCADETERYTGDGRLLKSPRAGPALYAIDLGALNLTGQASTFELSGMPTGEYSLRLYVECGAPPPKATGSGDVEVSVSFFGTGDDDVVYKGALSEWTRSEPPLKFRKTLPEDWRCYLYAPTLPELVLRYGSDYTLTFASGAAGGATQRAVLRLVGSPSAT